MKSGLNMQAHKDTSYVTYKGLFANAIFSVKYTVSESDIVFHQHSFQCIHCLWMFAGRCVCAVYIKYHVYTCVHVYMCAYVCACM